MSIITKIRNMPASFWRFDVPTMLRMAIPFLFVLSGAYAFSDFVINSINANPVLNAIIFLSAGLDVVLIFINLVKMQSDMRGLIRFSTEVRSGLPMKEIMEHKWLQKLSIKHYLESIAGTGGKVSSRLDQSVIQDELQALSDEYKSKMELPQFLVSFMVALGLLGTFIGLLTTLTGISTMLSGMGGENAQEEFMHLVGQLQKPLAGMGIAFSSSMFGLVSSLMLAIMMTTLHRFMNKVIEKARTVMKQVTTRVSHEAADSPQEIALGPNSTPQAITSQVVNSINALVRRMDVVAKQMEKGAELQRQTNEILEFGPKLKTTADKILQEFRGLGESQEETRKHVRKVISGLTEIEQALITNGPQDLIAGQKDMTSKLSELFSSSQSQTTLLGSLLEANRETSTDLVDGLRDMNESTKNELHALGIQQKDGQKIIQKLSHNLVQIEQSLMANSPRELVQAMNETNAKLQEIFAASQTQSNMSGTLLETQKDSADRIAHSLDGLKDHFANLEDLSSALGSSVNTIKGDIMRSGASLAILENVAEALSRQYDLLEGAQSQAREQHSQFLEFFGSHMQTILNLLKEKEVGNDPAPSSEAPLEVQENIQASSSAEGSENFSDYEE